MGEERSGLSAGTNKLAERITAALPTLSKKHGEIARFVLDNQDFVAFASASEVGDRTGSSAATVVRFCQTLGYAGYIELQEAIRTRVTLQRTAVQRLEAQMAGPIDNGDLLTRVFATDIHNIERTAVLTPRDRLQAAAAEMRRARQVLIVGSGMATALIDCLAYSLQVVDVATRVVTGGEEPLALALAFLQPEDVVIAISLRANPRYAVKAIEEARVVGAKSIGIAHSELSPILQQADYAFQVVADGVSHGPSPTAAASLLNALVATLSLSAPEQTARSLQQIDSTYRRSGLLDE